MTWIRMAQLLDDQCAGASLRTVTNLVRAASRRSYLCAREMSGLFAALSHLLHIARPNRRVQLIGFEDDNPVGRGANQPFSAQVTNDARHNWATGADGVGDFLLCPAGHQATSLLAGCGQVEQVAGHPLAE